MAEMLLINPRKRRKTAKRRATPVAAKRRVVRKRRANPIAAVARRVKRRANPISRVTRRVRRRRNPIGGSARISVNSIVAMLKDAVIGGVGAVGVDVLMGRINPMLPAAIQTSPSKIGAGDAVKALLTVVLGKALKKPTKGLSEKMALGALTTQARDLISSQLPTSLTLGYYSPAALTQGTNRVQPIRSGVNAYQQGGKTALLSAYTKPGTSTLLSGTAMRREGVIHR